MTKQSLDVSRIHVIASTQVCDSVPEAVACQIRIETLQPEIDLRGRPSALFKRELLQQLYNPLRQWDGPDRGLVLCGA